MYELYVVIQNWLLVQHECLIHVHVSCLVTSNNCTLYCANTYTCIIIYSVYTVYIHVYMYCSHVCAQDLLLSDSEDSESELSDTEQVAQALELHYRKRKRWRKRLRIDPKVREAAVRGAAVWGGCSEGGLQ